MSSSLKDRYDSTPLFGGNAPFVEHCYEEFLRDPGSVSDVWRAYFRNLVENPGAEVARGPVERRLAKQAAERRPGQSVAPGTGIKQAAVARLIQVYRQRGHQVADLDPLGLWQRQIPSVLTLEYFGLGESDMSTEFHTGGFAGTTRLPLRDLLVLLRKTYSDKIGADFAHVSRARERRWLQDRFESPVREYHLTREEKSELLQSLTGAEGIERYLHTRYVGQKRFSLEGGEVLIPLINDLIQQGGRRGVEELVIGMAHRGRINVLVNVVGKAPDDLFSEFEGKWDPSVHRGSGDVKYHMGFSTDIKTPGGNVHVTLAFNPSHLEIVNPVVEGSVRARQERRGDAVGDTVLPVLVHGDAAFAGQGVIMETLQLSQTRGFRTGGTVHVIVNNQIGFTMSEPQDARSTPYSSDVAKMIEAPIFHVNADDPEAVIFVTRLALDYRRTFHKDVVIDLVCYRRHGHNEADEPAATQPVMYKAIRKHKTTRQLYAERLVQEQLITEQGAADLVEQFRDRLDTGGSVSNVSLGMIGNKYTVDWSHFNGELADEVDSSISLKRLQRLAKPLVTVPAGMKLHARVQRIVGDRVKMASGELPMDWGFAETLAYASLLDDGYGIRITGQDSGRGTFFHRHAVWHNQSDNATYCPLEHVIKDQPRFAVIDSLLSEEAVLGFEYGYSAANPDQLVIWEGQFGDFVNGAQVVIDQFISSGEAKWGRLCGLTLFLPHGYEGQGPEHSSARLERFLQLCAEHNMQVCVPSTPAQMFHMLRRQMLRKARKPLIVMTPKSLLRHRLSVSTQTDLTSGSFQNVIPEMESIRPGKVQRVVFCSGKIYYDLLEARQTHGVENVAIVRIEQLYPFPADEYAEVIEQYRNAKDIVWCQEEPQNQGAWYQIRHRLQEALKVRHKLFYAGRTGAAAPASGIYAMHLQQQQALVEAALNIEPAVVSVEEKSPKQSGRK
ncbi:MAG: 2-oxoglutarate dehydrogenase E1 component [Gammaproteobacteria bacterium]|jgi:2-oxoglutarate dehydrogenase E1 component|nr:2-oxoglutarate dehydrogenase E1 component [Gammaproteobacteria bacterium]